MTFFHKFGYRNQAEECFGLGGIYLWAKKFIIYYIILFMAIHFQPKCGAVLVCDFHGYIEPEIVKRRPVIVISPQMSDRPDLCTVVPCSTTEPFPIKPYHYKLLINPLWPGPYNSPFQWIKGDLVYTVSFDRLFVMANGRDSSGKRIFDPPVLSTDELKKVKGCVLSALGFKFEM